MVHASVSDPSLFIFLLNTDIIGIKSCFIKIDYILETWLILNASEWNSMQTEG